jgi:polyisoprenoid-binding protein YceI
MQAISQPSPGRYLIQSSNGAIAWTATQLGGLVTVRGNFKGVVGTLDITHLVVDSRIRASIDVSTLSTGNPRRDSHLLTTDFLHATEYPKIEFSSTNIIETGPDSWAVRGDLTVHGTTRPVSLGVTLVSNAPRFRITAQINRRDFGVTKGPSFFIGSQISVDFEVEPKRDG